MTEFKKDDRVYCFPHDANGVVKYVGHSHAVIAIRPDEERWCHLSDLRLLPPRIMPEQIKPATGDGFYWKALLPCNGGGYLAGSGVYWDAKAVIDTYDAAVGAVEMVPALNPDGSVKVVWRDEVKPEFEKGDRVRCDSLGIRAGEIIKITDQGAYVRDDATGEYRWCRLDALTYERKAVTS